MSRHDPARHDHDGLDRRPDGVRDETVAAVGKLTEALERVERARGRLYDFHQLMGSADALMGEAADMLADAGHDDWADRVQREIVGRNVLDGRWTFQIVEEFDALYYDAVRTVERQVRDDLTAGRPHVFEAEMKAERRSPGEPGHDATPDDVS
jgi:hypothetical protein